MALPVALLPVAAGSLPVGSGVVAGSDAGGSVVLGLVGGLASTSFATSGY